VQTIINLDDGSSVSITTAKYLTPSGQDVNKDKIHPDVVIEPTDEDLKTDNDVQLKRAVEILRERLGANQAKSEGRS
jgi:carboxyl-terminal processing protease